MQENENGTLVRIKKAQLKDDLFLYVEYIEELPGHSKKDTKVSITVPVHQDLKDAFKKLHTHLAILCDEVTEPKRKDIDTTVYEAFTVKSLSIGGNGENEGVTLSGSKEGKYGTVNLNTPFCKYLGSEYKMADILAVDVEHALFEVNEYVFNGKQAPDQQMEMDFGELKMLGDVTISVNDGEEIKLDNLTTDEFKKRLKIV